MSEKKDKFKIGLVVGNIDEAFSNQICKGAMRATELVGDDLFIFPMKYLNIDFAENDKDDYTWEYQYNYLAAYAQAAKLDLVILCFAPIGNMATKHQAEYMLNNFGDTPLFMVASDEQDYSSIKFDNKDGIVEGLEYLINERGCKHICFLSGPLNNHDACDRYDAYKEVMAKHGMPTDDSRVAYGYLNADCEEQVNDLLIRNPAADAIVCANDLMAKAVYSVLQRCDFKIGKDICVIGFDNSEDTEVMTPPLASVSAEASALGYRAFIEGHNLLKEYGKENYPVKKFVEKTAFVNRESASGINSQKRFVSEEEKKTYLDRIHNMTSIDHKMNLLSRDMLMYENSGDQTFGSILKALCPIKDIEDCYLLTFNKPISYRANQDWKLPESMYLRAYKHGKNVIEVPSNKQRIKIVDLFENRYFAEEAKKYVIIDLFCRDKQYGIMICSMPYEMVHYVENLGYKVSIALKIKELFAAKEKLLEERADMLYLLECENNYLDNISHYDELTGIFNRRGFNSQVPRYLKNQVYWGKRSSLIMVDLNDLKKINDFFGHDEGDYALKKVAEALSYVVDKKGIACRIGGDEFVCIVMLDEEDSVSEIKKKIKKYLKDSNKKSDRKYDVMASVGGTEFIVSEDIDLRGLLSKADQKLYADKRKKGNFVIKENA